MFDGDNTSNKMIAILDLIIIEVGQQCSNDILNYQNTARKYIGLI